MSCDFLLYCFNTLYVIKQMNYKTNEKKINCTKFYSEFSCIHFQ